MHNISLKTICQIINKFLENNSRIGVNGHAQNCFVIFRNK